MPPKKAVAAGKPKGASKVHIRHILCEKQSKLIQAKTRINNGEDFAAVARELSEDKARSGGDLGWVLRGAIVSVIIFVLQITSFLTNIISKEFEDVAFALQAGEISQPFKTGHGWHIAKCEG